MTRELFEQIVKEGRVPRIPTVSYFRANPEALEALTVEKLVRYVPMVGLRAGLMKKYGSDMKLDKSKVDIPVEINETIKEDLDSTPVTVKEDLDSTPVTVKEEEKPTTVKEVIETVKKSKKSKSV